MPSPRYVRPILFKEAVYAPTLPPPLRPTYKGCGCGCKGAPGGCRDNTQPSGLISGVRRLSGLSGGFGALDTGSLQPTPMHYVYGAASLAGTALGAYHGYKRNRGSVGWAIVWGLLGGAFPIITVPVALAQGFGERA